MVCICHCSPPCLSIGFLISKMRPCASLTLAWILKIEGPSRPGVSDFYFGLAAFQKQPNGRITEKRQG